MTERMTMNYELMMRRANRILPAMMAESLPRIFLDSCTATESDPCVQVDTRDMQTMWFVVPIEPNALSLPIDVNRQKEPVVALGPYRVALPFQKIDSQSFTVAKSTVASLPGSDRHHMLLRDFGADPLLRVENKQFLRHVAAAAGLTTFGSMKAGSDPIQCVKDGGFENTLGVSDSRVFNEAVYMRMMKSLMRRQVHLRAFLMHLDTFEAAVESLGIKDVEVSAVGAHTAIFRGIKFHTPSIYQMECIMPGHVYGFGDRSCLGKHITLSSPKLWISEQKDNPSLLDVRSWEVTAMGITLTDACTVMVLAGAEPLMVEVTQSLHKQGHIMVGG